MPADFIEIHPENPEGRKIAEIVKHLNNGGVIIYPTDSVYNFGCSLNSKRAIEKIAQIKGLKLKKAQFALVCDNLKTIDEFTKQYSRSTFKLLNKYLPGPFTFILEASNKIPKLFDSNKKEVGIRIPNNNIALAIVQELGHPLVTSSVHDDDEIIDYITDPEVIYNNFQHKVEAIIDGGMGNNEPSTIVDCTGDFPEIIRQGIGEIDL